MKTHLATATLTRASHTRSGTWAAWVRNRNPHCWTPWKEIRDPGGMLEVPLPGVPCSPLAYLEILPGHQWSWGPGYEAGLRAGVRQCPRKVQSCVRRCSSSWLSRFERLEFIQSQRSNVWGELWGGNTESISIRPCFTFPSHQALALSGDPGSVTASPAPPKRDDPGSGVLGSSATEPCMCRKSRGHVLRLGQILSRNHVPKLSCGATTGYGHRSTA